MSSEMTAGRAATPGCRRRRCAGRALDDHGLADACFADQHGIVLRAPAEHLDDAADLVVAPDDRVELAVVGLGGEVAAVALECLDLLLRRLVGDGVGRTSASACSRCSWVAPLAFSALPAGLSSRVSASRTCSTDT
jgi:hypothetical protein